MSVATKNGVVNVREFVELVKLSRAAQLISSMNQEVPKKLEEAWQAIDGLDVEQMLLDELERRLDQPMGEPMDQLEEGCVKANTGLAVYHRPTCEVWYVIGCNWMSRRVCAAGYPASIAEMKDCILLFMHGPLNEHELEHRRKTFGGGWT